MNHRVYSQTVKADGHTVNEDRYMFSEFSFNTDTGISLMVVADGMGGLADGEKASRNAVSGFLNAFYAEAAQNYMDHAVDPYEDEYSLEYGLDEVADILVRAVKKANALVCEKADPLRQTGTTISAACVVGKFAVIVNVGDSPVYFYRKRTGRLKLVSVLQTAAEMDVENGLYKRYSEEYYANDHRIYCSLGQYNELSEDDICLSSIGRLEDGDIILLGSDGAFGRMLEGEILDEIDQCSEDAEEYVLDNIFEQARMDKDDDQTAIMYVVATEG